MDLFPSTKYKAENALAPVRYKARLTSLPVFSHYDVQILPINKRRPLCEMPVSFRARLVTSFDYLLSIMIKEASFEKSCTTFSCCRRSNELVEMNFCSIDI